MPTNLKKNHPIYFAIDNVDLKIDTCDGKRQLYGTGTAVYWQKREENEVTREHNLIKISKHKPENKIVLALVCSVGTLCIIQVSSVILSLTSGFQALCIVQA